MDDGAGFELGASDLDLTVEKHATN
jgi:hypothetical protein